MKNMLHTHDVAAIVLNYKGSRDTVACLDSLYALASPPGSIIVVDNASPDDSVRQILGSWKQWASPHLVRPGSAEEAAPPTSALLLQLDNNNGYASGNNAGIRLAQVRTPCTAYWILNNDTLPEPHALEALCARYNAVGQDALIGSTLVFVSQPDRVQCAAGDSVIDWLGITRPVCGGMPLSSVLGLRNDDVEKQLGQISGASLLVSQKSISRIGLFREDFFLYLEDTDFSLRARKAGIPLLWARESIVLHKEGGSTGAASANNTSFQRPQSVDYLMLRNRARLVKDNSPLGIPLLCFSYLAVASKRILRKQSDRVSLVFRALWHGLTGKLGKPS